MDFYRVIHKIDNTKMILAIFLCRSDAYAYCQREINLHHDEFYVDTVSGDNDISSSFLNFEE